MCIKLVELCCSLSEYFEQIITGVLLCSNNKEADDGGLIQAFWPFMVFKSQASVIKSCNTCDLQRVTGLRSKNYGAWKNAQVSHVESKCNEMNSYKHCSF